MSKKHDTNVGDMTPMSHDSAMAFAHHIASSRPECESSCAISVFPQMMAYFLCTKRYAGIGLLCLQSACLFAPPLQLEEPFENHPPFIGASNVSPQATTVVASADSSVTMSVETVYDQDQESELFYAWYSVTLGTITTGTLDPLDDEFSTRVDGIFYEYNGTSYELSPCQIALRGRQSETLWLYITDRQWERTSSAGVEIDDGAFLASWSWVVDLRDVTCGG